MQLFQARPKGNRIFHFRPLFTRFQIRISRIRNTDNKGKDILVFIIQNHFVFFFSFPFVFFLMQKSQNTVWVKNSNCTKCTLSFFLCVYVCFFLFFCCVLYSFYKAIDRIYRNWKKLRKRKEKESFGTTIVSYNNNNTLEQLS